MITGLLRQADSLVQALGAVGSDVKSVVDGSEPLDWFDRRDPEYIRRTLPGMKAISDVYFRGEVRGLENLPADGPVLLVGNHSGGTLIADTFVFSQAFYEQFGPTRALPTGRRGSRPRSTSTGARASPALRSSTMSRSSRWWPSAARKPRCSSAAVSASLAPCSSTGSRG
jgi:hypothetical protein